MSTWREFYQDAGLASIPLKAGSKKPALRGWADRPPADLWRDVRGPANVGLRCGDAGLAALDFDDFPTAEQGLRFLAGLGLENPPGAVTRRGQHVYLRTAVPVGFRAGQLAPEGWSGELRGWRSYVVAPASVVGGWTYKPVGALERLPLVDWRDLSPLVSQETAVEHTPTVSAISHFAVRLPLAQGTTALIDALREAEPGDSVNAFTVARASRSEALAVLWVRCFQAGMPAAEAARLVGSIPGRSLQDLEADCLRVYGKVLASRAGLADRSAIMAGFTLPGRSDRVRTDAKVYSAALRLATQTGPGFLMHSTQIAAMTSIPQRTVYRSLTRLAAAGLVRFAQRRQWHGFYLEVKR